MGVLRLKSYDSTMPCGKRKKRTRVGESMTYRLPVVCDVSDCRYNDKGKFPRCAKPGEIRITRTLEAIAECKSYKRRKEAIGVSGGFVVPSKGPTSKDTIIPPAKSEFEERAKRLRMSNRFFYEKLS
jgi:hypothetical protein